MVSSELLELLVVLQSLKGLYPFALAGGTNLSIRYHHRASIDIDLFSNQVVGLDGLRSIEQEIWKKFPQDVSFINIEDPGLGEQYCFIKSLIRKGAVRIKVEILQNIQILYPIEQVNNLRLISEADIGIMKLESLSSRKAHKDVYDLDTITDRIPLGDLLAQLRLKKAKFLEANYKCLFDLDEQADPLANPLLLLAFDKIDYQKMAKRPSHSNDILKINEGRKSWVQARAHWKTKVVAYCKEHQLPVPGLRPIT